MNSFLVNPKDGTINIHYDGLTPGQVMSLIRRLEANAKMLAMLDTDPISIFKRSAQINQDKHLLTFQFSWNAPLIEIDLLELVIETPEPNVELNPEQLAEYRQIFQNMIKSYRVIG